jgi:LacI family transcriptional regulator
MAGIDRLNMPVVALDHDATSYGYDSFCFDNHAAGAALARRLCKWNHRRVALISESLDKPERQRDAAWTERRAGFLDAWGKAGRPSPTELFVRDRGEATEKMSGLLGRVLSLPAGERPTALFSPASLPVEERREIAEKTGIRIPDGLTFVGCGLAPREKGTTGFRFREHELGFEAACHMLSMIRNRRPRSLRPSVMRVKGIYVAGSTHARAVDRS